MNAVAPSENAEKAPILIIEDDRFLRDLVSEKLKKEGYMVSTAIDGKEGLQKLTSDHPALILLDLILPEVDGFDFLKQANTNMGNAMPPVVVLSNLGSKEDVERALALGAKFFIVKANFTPDEIIAKVRDVLHETK